MQLKPNQYCSKKSQVLVLGKNYHHQSCVFGLDDEAKMGIVDVDVDDDETNMGIKMLKTLCLHR